MDTSFQAINELQTYIIDKQAEDYLLIGFSTSTQNPYREKSRCVVL